MDNLSTRAIIKTKYLAPTNCKGARIRATCKAGSVSISYPYSLSGTACHWQAAQALIDKLSLDWGDSFAIGEDDAGCYFVPVSDCNVVVK